MFEYMRDIDVFQDSDDEVEVEEKENVENFFPPLINDIVDIFKKIFLKFGSQMNNAKFLCKSHSDKLPENTFCAICLFPCKYPKRVFAIEPIKSRMLKNILINHRNISENDLIVRLSIPFRKQIKSDMKMAFQTRKPILAPIHKDKEGGPSSIGNILEEEEEEDLGIGLTFNEYKPKKLAFGLKHPDAVVETASLASVDPPDIHYKLCLPPSIVNERKLSSLQLEAIVYAQQNFEKLLPDGTRAGFLIGDGAGVGKGRTIAGAIYENFLRGRKKSIWISISSDLKFDADRDLKDITAPIPVRNIRDFSYNKIVDFEEGVLFSTYMSLVGHKSIKSQNKNKSDFFSRFDQIIDWCGNDFDGMIVFDESHKAKNLISTTKFATKTGLRVLDLQLKLPNA